MFGISLTRQMRNAPMTLRARVRVWLHRRHARAALAKLDDHMLADIGVSRGRADADAEASKSFWND